jgi:ABC-2 type transport system ATP-binding protein
LRHRFGDKVAVDGIDLCIERGEVFGLLGPNGAGKTTTIRVVNTLLPVQEGAAEVLGFDLRRSTMAIRRRLGYVPQQLSIESALTGRENVTWFARLFDVPRAERKERVADALDVMGLGDVADRMAGTYSGGMIRRLELAQALVNRPELLVLDEPTVGLDPVARDGVWRRVVEMRDATGMTVLLTTHYMEEADVLCDRLALMHLGRIRALGTPENSRRSSARRHRSRMSSVATPGIRSTRRGKRREVCVRSAQLDAPPAGWGESDHAADPAVWRQFPNRVATFCLVEIQKLRHDRTEIFTRAVQPVLWLLIFGETFNRIHAIPTGGVPYLDFLAPGIIAQSGLFVAIFYGIQIIWERDAGVLTKLLVTPTPRASVRWPRSWSSWCCQPSWASP